VKRDLERAFFSGCASLQEIPTTDDSWLSELVAVSLLIRLASQVLTGTRAKLPVSCVQSCTLLQLKDNSTFKLPRPQIEQYIFLKKSNNL